MKLMKKTKECVKRSCNELQAKLAATNAAMCASLQRIRSKIGACGGAADKE